MSFSGLEFGPGSNLFDGAEQQKDRSRDQDRGSLGEKDRPFIMRRMQRVLLQSEEIPQNLRALQGHKPLVWMLH